MLTLVFQHLRQVKPLTGPLAERLYGDGVAKRREQEEKKKVEEAEQKRRVAAGRRKRLPGDVAARLCALSRALPLALVWEADREPGEMRGGALSRLCLSPCLSRCRLSISLCLGTSLARGSGTHMARRALL
jgi:hypothetical protein